MGVVRRSGPVAIGDVTFTAEELSIEGEVGILNRLRRLAKDALGPGGFYKNALPVAKWLREQGEGAEAAALLAETARLVATGGPLDEAAVWEFRQTPAGVAAELYMRTRKAHPDTREDELRAVINDANVVEVRLQLLEALADPKAPTPSGS